MTLAQKTVEEARRLLDAGHTYRGVVRLMPGRISRGSVSKIARGEYVIKQRRPAEVAEEVAPNGPIARCQCGLLVTIPCLACKLERCHTPRPIAVGIEEALEEPGLQLSGGERQRYEEVRAAKLAAEGNAGASSLLTRSAG